MSTAPSYCTERIVVDAETKATGIVTRTSPVAPTKSVQIALPQGQAALQA